MIIEEFKVRDKYGTNAIIVVGGNSDTDIKLDNSKIHFNGENNILIVDKGIVFKNSNIKFQGNNGLGYIRKPGNPAMLNVDIFSSTCLFIDQGSTYNGVVTMSCSEREGILVGKDKMFSLGLKMRTSDVHLLYDSDGKRINNSAGIIIGDHVWTGQDTTYTKGAIVGSGAVIGVRSVANGRIEANCVYAGVPCKKIRENIFWDRPSTHNYSYEKTLESQEFQGDINKFNYTKDNDSNIDEKLKIYEEIKSAKTVPEKIDLIDRVWSKEPLVF